MNDEEEQDDPVVPADAAGARRPRGRPRKATEEWVDLAEAMLGKAPKNAIKAAVMKAADCKPRTAEDIITRAKERLRAQVNEPVDLQRAKYLAIYDSIAFDTSVERDGDGNPTGRRRVSDRDRIMAADKAADLLGLKVHTHAPAASKEDLIRQFLEDPAAKAAAFGPGMLPSPPAPKTDAPAQPQPDQAVEAPAAARGAEPAVLPPGPVQDGRGGPTVR